MFEIIVLIHVAALLWCNFTTQPEDKTTMYGRYYWVIEIVAGLFTDKVKK